MLKELKTKREVPTWMIYSLYVIINIGILQLFFNANSEHLEPTAIFYVIPFLLSIFPTMVWSKKEQ